MIFLIPGGFFPYHAPFSNASYNSSIISLFSLYIWEDKEEELEADKAELVPLSEENNRFII